MGLHSQYDPTDRVCPNGQNPSGHEHHKVPKTGRSETILKTDLVNLKSVWQIPFAHGVPPTRQFYPTGIWQERHNLSTKRYDTGHITPENGETIRRKDS
jgi:hypothetical protein